MLCFALLLLHADGRWQTGGTVVFSHQGQGHAAALASVQPSFLPSVSPYRVTLSNFVQSHNVSSKILFSHPGRMNMDEGKQRPPGTTNTPPLLNLTVNMTKEVVMPAAVFFFLPTRPFNVVTAVAESGVRLLWSSSGQSEAEAGAFT